MESSHLAIAIAVAVVTTSLSIITYNLFFHPLRRFPGPLLHRATRLALTWDNLSGRQPFRILAYHERYGPVVRIAPNELAFIQPQAWRDIYGHRKDLETKEIPKWIKFYRQWKSRPQSILNADYEFHSTLRRSLAPSFSEKMMREQEPMIGTHVDLLIRRLKEGADKGAQNMRDWYNWTTFDIIGDLAFGESFHCLENTENHSLIRLASEGLLESLATTQLRLIGLKWLALAIKLTLARKTIRRMAQSRAKFQARMDSGSTRPDLVDSLIKKKHEESLTTKDILPTAMVLIVAGSETTATLLCGITFLLLMNPRALSEVTAEVRSAFKTEDEITLTSVQQLSYMLECLTEALRCYPPVPVGLPRLTPKGGVTIAGHFVPEDTVISTHQWAAGHSKESWADPDSFRPERHRKEGEFANDKTDASQPFSVGPRNCLGMNLAYAEMRLILARILFNFDMKLGEESKDWIKTQNVYGIWQKPSLWVHLTRR